MTKKPEMKTIPLFDPWFPPSYADDVRNQILTGWIGPGPKCAEFGDALAKFVDARHCILTTSGTMALSVAAIALGLQPGDEILVPAYGVISTIQAFASIGLVPRLVDIDKQSGCITAEHVAIRLTPRTRAVCYVNFSGYTGSQLPELVAFCNSRDIPLIEDAACGLGHQYESQFAGTFGSIGTYSFSVPKIITTGQGGAIVTASDEYRRRAIEYIDHGDIEWRKTNLNRGIGTNLRYNDILASLAMAQLQDLPTRLHRKRAVYDVLRDKLDTYLYQTPGDQSPLHYIVFARNPKSFVTYLRTQKINAALQYRIMYEHPPFANLRDRRFFNAEFWNDHAVYLPFGLSLEPSDAARIANAVLGQSDNLLPIILHNSRFSIAGTA